LVFAVGIGVGGVVLLAVLFNLLTAGLSLATLLFYSLFYTLWLKPHTPLNIVIGGAAGAMAPVGAWAAATGGTGLVPWILFLVVFLWTPPHFWSLALHFQDDYRLSGYPMLPVVKGEKAAVQQIERYTYALTAVSLAYLLAGGGVLYGIGAAVLGIGFIVKVAALKRGADRRSPWALFSYSILYLFGLFAAMIIDKFTERVW
jgi:protoheme IX farnesyltransferase